MREARTLSGEKGVRMPNKKVVLAALAAALLFGVVISGCNRNREPSVASAERRQRQQQRTRRDLDTGTTRPAEVLSASVRRTPQPRQTPDYQYSQPTVKPTVHSYYANGVQMAQVYEPLPEPIPVEHLPAYRQQQATYYASSGTYYADGGSSYYAQQSQPYYAQPYQATSYAQTSYYEPIEVIHPSPELAMAKAQLQNPAVITPVYTQPMPQTYIPVPVVEARPAPIPELEPVRYQRVAQRQIYVEPPPPAPVPVMMSAAPARHGQQSLPRNDTQRALAPLSSQSQQPVQSQGWVSSPTTAMRTMYR